MSRLSKKTAQSVGESRKVALTESVNRCPCGGECDCCNSYTGAGMADGFTTAPYYNIADTNIYAIRNPKS